MLLDIVWLVVGLVLILAGASFLTDGSASIARRMGISDLVVGLTVVAFGTSSPELVISMLSAIDGSTGLAIGNVVGSNIFNVCVIIGIVALLRPIKVENGIMANEIPLVILSSVALLIIGCGVWLDGDATAVVSSVSGLLLLLFFAIFMRYTFATAHNGSGSPSSEEAPAKQLGVARSVLYVIAGLAALVWGGDRFVSGASGLALAFGVSESVVGLTIVAAGTSLPELATSVAAALKGRPGIAIGNVIGSNIFNIFLVLGASATIRPLYFGTIGLVDLLLLVGTSVLFYLFGWLFGHRIIKRSEGAVLVAVYIGYIIYLISNL